MAGWTGGFLLHLLLAAAAAEGGKSPSMGTVEGASRCWGNHRQPQPAGFPEGMVWGRVNQGIYPAWGREGAEPWKAAGGRQSRGGHCARWLPAGLGEAGRVQAELWWDLLLPRVLPGFVHPCWGLWGPQGCVSPVGKAGMQIP